MVDQGGPALGTICWVDLTVPDAPALRDFYADVVGWKPKPVAMDGYDDFSMFPAPEAGPAAGICHARGENAALPPQWLVYIAVADVEASARRCVERGGRVVAGPKGAGGSRYCVIQDPAGAYAALISSAPAEAG